MTTTTDGRDTTHIDFSAAQDYALARYGIKLPPARGMWASREELSDLHEKVCAAHADAHHRVVNDLEENAKSERRALKAASTRILKAIDVIDQRATARAAEDKRRRERAETEHQALCDLWGDNYAEIDNDVKIATMRLHQRHGDVVDAEPIVNEFSRSMTELSRGICAAIRVAAKSATVARVETAAKTRDDASGISDWMVRSAVRDAVGKYLFNQNFGYELTQAVEKATEALLTEAGGQYD